ncbi:MAG TPA: ABC transporter permease [Candidatus Ratteibacteria bacterium]|nr:ABC transporter permease [Candidatus Ratteibacteria bacterium]
MGSYNFFLSKKFLSRKKDDHFLWFINFFSIAGIAIGVIALILVIGVMNGFSNDLKKKIIGANPVITIEGKPSIYDYQNIIKKIKENVEEVEGISPFISTQVIYKSDNYMLGGILKGIESDTEKDVTNLEKFIVKGKYSDIENGIILGKELAKELEVVPGDNVWIIVGLIPKQMCFKVVGIFDYGIYSFDVSTGFVSLKNLMDFLNINSVHGIGIKIDNIYNSKVTAEKIKKVIAEEYSVSTWIEKNKILFSALALEKKAMAIILSLIIIVASFNIASTLMISVYKKVKDIGILKAIGLTRWEIKKIFFYQGLILGVKGLFSGLVIGLSLSFIVKKYQFIKIPEFVYDLSHLPIEISVMDILWICILVLVIVSFASIYPSTRAAKLNPAEAIRNE